MIQVLYFVVNLSTYHKDLCTLLQISLPTWPATKLQMKLELQVWILDAPNLIGFEVHVLGMCYITCLLVLVQCSEFCGGKQQQLLSMQASNSSMFRWEI
jgi:hypothetical protein